MHKYTHTKIKAYLLADAYTEKETQKGHKHMQLLNTKQSTSIYINTQKQAH